MIYVLFFVLLYFLSSPRSYYFFTFDKNLDKKNTVEEKYDILSEQHKYLLNVLLIFGNEKTNLSFVIDNFFEDQKTEEFYDLIYDLRDASWLVLEKDKYFISKEVEDFLFKFYPPKVENSEIVIEYFLKILIPPFKNRLEIETELLLLKVLYRIKGNSKSLAQLNDYYAQYLDFIGEYQSAIKFYSLAVKIYSSLKIQDSVLCNFYNHLAEEYFKIADYDNALAISYKTENIIYSLSFENIVLLVYTYTLISHIYFKQKKYQLAYSYAKKALDIAKNKVIDKNILADLYYETAIIAMKLKKYDKALFLLEKSYDYAQNVSTKEKNYDLLERIRSQKHYLQMLNKLDFAITKIGDKKIIFFLIILIILIIVVSVLL